MNVDALTSKVFGSVNWVDGAVRIDDVAESETVKEEALGTDRLLVNLADQRNIDEDNDLVDLDFAR